MANIASITVVFVGKGEELKRLADLLKCDTEEEDRALSNKLEIGDLDFSTNAPEDDRLSLYGWSKWDFHKEAMDRFLMENGLEGLTYYYAAEEPGCEFFVNTDESREYIDYDYYIWGSKDEGVYDEYTWGAFSESEANLVLEDLKKWLNVSDNKELDTLEKTVDYFNENYRGPDDYILLKKFTS